MATPRKPAPSQSATRRPPAARTAEPKTEAPRREAAPPPVQEEDRQPPRQEVAVREENTEVGEALPDFMREDIGKGTENISASEVELPRIKLLQANSPELEEFTDLRAGDFFNTMTESALGRELDVVVLHVEESYILWRPRDDGGGILARAADGIHWNPSNTEFKVRLDKKDGGNEVVWRTAKTVSQSRLAEWGTMNPADPNSPPAATKMYNMLIAMPGLDEPPSVVTLQRSAIKVARRFLGKLKVTAAPSFGLIFTMKAFQDTNSKGDKFWNYAFARNGVVQDKDQYDYYKSIYESVSAAGLNIRNIDSLQAEEAEIPDDAGAATTATSEQARAAPAKGRRF